MKKTSLRVVALLVSIVICTLIFASCGGKDVESKKPASKSESEEDKKGETADSKKDGESESKDNEWPEPNEMPIVEEKIKLTMFTTFPPGHAEMWESLNDMPSMQALEEITNIEVDMQGIPATNYGERKNLMFASGNLPDIIYSSSAAADALKYGIDDDLIIPLDELIEKYAYNFNMWMDSEPTLREQITMADGKIYYMPYTDISLKNIIQVGYYMREEWIEKFNIEPPETLDDLYEVLKMFKVNDPAGGGKTLPLAAPNTADLTIPIFGSYGTNHGIYRVDNEIKYGPIEPAFKEALIYLNKLYGEGLIASDYLTHDADIYNANLPDNIGITHGYTNGALRTPLQAAGFNNQESKDLFRPISGMKGPDGKYYWFRAPIGNVVNTLGECITSSNKHPVETMKWIDYKYSKEGSYTMNYGPKGKTWDLDDEGVKYTTDYVLKNPDGLTPDEAMLKGGMMIWAYTVGVAGVNRVAPTSRWPYQDEDVDYLRTNYGEPEDESVYSKHFENWMDFDASRQLPPHIKYTAEEQEEIAVLSQDITTYVNENMHRFIMGLEPIEKWNDVVNQLKGMNVDRFIEIHQGALDRVQ